MYQITLNRIIMEKPFVNDKIILIPTLKSPPLNFIDQPHHDLML